MTRKIFLVGFILVVACSVFAQTKVSIKTREVFPLPEMIYTFNTQLVLPAMNGTFQYGSKRYNETVKALKPAALRFPGGTMGNHYDWRNDSFYVPSDDFTVWAKKLIEQFVAKGKPYGMNGYVRSAQRLGMEEIYVANIFSESPQSIVEMIKAIRDLGGEAKYVELGNEAYWDPKCHNDVEAYEALARPVAAAIRAYDPGIRIGVCVGPIGKRGNYEEIWNAPIGADPSWYDAIIHHEYIGGQGLPVDESMPGSLSNAVYPEEEMEHSLAEIRKTNPGKPIWMTEYNLGKKLVDENWGTMGHLMGIAAMQVFLLNHPEEFEIASFHQIYGKRWSPVHWDGEEKRLVRNPAFLAYQQIGDAMHGMEQLHLLDIDVASGAPPTRREFEAVAFGREGSIESVLFLNKSPEPVDVQLAKGQAATVRSLSSGAMTDVFPSEVDDSQFEHIEGKGTIALPGNSINWIRFD